MKDFSWGTKFVWSSHTVEVELLNSMAILVHVLNVESWATGLGRCEAL